MSDTVDSFASFGVSYQEKVTQAILSDPLFAEQMHDLLLPKYFELSYLQEIVEKFYAHRQKFKTFASPDVLSVMISNDTNIDGTTKSQVKEFFTRVLGHPLNGDTGYIQDSSLEFCKKQSLKEGLIKAIDMMESGNYDSIQSVIRESLNKGGSRDIGHDYLDGFAKRGEKALRKPISTGWSVIDREFNGGWERATLSTFIAPTGAGKSMFLVNCGASLIAQGLNVLYVTCEMADYKIGLRFDSYFSGVEINKVSDNPSAIEEQVRGCVSGRLYIKEFGTKTATVQTIRAYIQRLIATKNFMPDMLIVDYADLLRGSRSYGEKRHELEGVYEELRALAQELNIVVITADQTNRSGMDMEVVTISQIGESYAKATVCDVILTVSRRPEDKQMNAGRLFIAKSRLGRDGMVFPFTMNSATVKAIVHEQGHDPIAEFMGTNNNMQKKMGERFEKLMGKHLPASGSR